MAVSSPARAFRLTGARANWAKRKLTASATSPPAAGKVESTVMD